MLLALDIGNTNIVAGIFHEDRLLQHWRMETNKKTTVDEYAMVIKSFFSHFNLNFTDIEKVIISSVVPSLTSVFAWLCKNYLECEAIIVTSELEINLDNVLSSSSNIGSDRLVNAVAALKQYNAPMIIIDFGTATTYCYIDENKRYCGGAIAPGILIATEALYTKTAKLPHIDLVIPKKVIGTTTTSAMQSGILYGYICQVEGMIKKMWEEIGRKTKVVATGGLASIIAGETDIIDSVDPMLTLFGLYYIANLNKVKTV